MKVLFGFIAFMIALTLFLSIYLQPSSFSLCPMTEGPASREGCKAVDAIVAVSGGDTAARTAHAVELYQKGWAPVLVFSGAAQDKSGPSNAQAMRTQAVAAGVPSSAILIEEDSENTEQNALNTVRLFRANNIGHVVLVTSGYHQRRASLEFSQKVEGMSVTIQNSPTFDKDWNWYWWATPRGWWLALSELGKIIAFHTGIGK